MVELLQTNWILVVAALVIGLLVAWWIFVASRRTKVQLEDRDETGDTGVKRNQALIDAPASVFRDGTPPAEKDPQDREAAETAASPGAVSAAANADTTAAAPLGTDAETGDGTPLRQAMHETPAEPAPAPAPASDGDDLTRIKGVGPKLVTMLRDEGVTSFAQIAGWNDADIDRIDARLGRFQGRIRRDNWVEQASLLQSGDTAAYEAKFGRTS